MEKAVVENDEVEAAGDVKDVATAEEERKGEGSEVVVYE